ncbi:MAG TPA: NADPH-dependent FMN reductase [Roseiflexaceae bacterium]|nr:NADPH-dependent FMN reductase [Roseiflexaceae bacterium]
MAAILTIGGSPSAVSRSSAVLEYARAQIGRAGLEAEGLSVRDLPPEDLIFARFGSPAIQEAQARVAAAQGVIVATPVYKAAYSGVLKTFLDLLPAGALAGKTVLPIATGGAPTHMLALDYALKPVLAALGAQQTLAGVYILDAQIQTGEQFVLDPALAGRLDEALAELVEAVRRGS